MQPEIRVVGERVLRFSRPEEFAFAMRVVGNTQKFEEQEPRGLLVPKAMSPVALFDPEILSDLAGAGAVGGLDHRHVTVTPIGSSTAPPVASTLKTRNISSPGEDSVPALFET